MFTSLNGDYHQLIKRKEWRNILTLIKLAELGALRTTTKISTEYLADKLSFSQQTASRQLIELEKTNLIDRQISPEGSIIKITTKGFELEANLFTEINRLGYSLHQHPIVYRKRKGTSKLKITDGLKIAWFLITERVRQCSL